jgi:hypothetical protein
MCQITARNQGNYVIWQRRICQILLRAFRCPGLTHSSAINETAGSRLRRILICDSIVQLRTLARPLRQFVSRKYATALKARESGVISAQCEAVCHVADSGFATSSCAGVKTTHEV